MSSFLYIQEYIGRWKMLGASVATNQLIWNLLGRLMDILWMILKVMVTTFISVSLSNTI